MGAVTGLSQLRPFAHLSKPELRRLRRLRTTIAVPTGTVLAREGGPGRQFGVVVDGDALVTRAGHEVTRLDAGQIFGELAIVRGVPHPVTIVATTAMTLELMDVREFHSAYTTMPSLRRHVDHEVDRRLATWPDVGYTLAS